MSIQFRLSAGLPAALPEHARTGSAILPEVDDEVLVGFAHGEIRSPFVIGSLWDSKDKPPTER